MVKISSFHTSWKLGKNHSTKMSSLHCSCLEESLEENSVVLKKKNSKTFLEFKRKVFDSVVKTSLNLSRGTFQGENHSLENSYFIVVSQFRRKSSALFQMELTELSNEHSSSAVEHVEEDVVYLKMFLCFLKL